MIDSGQFAGFAQSCTSYDTIRHPLSPKMASLSTRLGMLAGTARPPTTAPVAPTGMSAEQTVIGSNAGAVVAGAGRSRMGTTRTRTPSPRGTAATRSGHVAPAGSTARTTSPDGTWATGAAME